MGPNSSYQFPISWNNHELKSDMYNFVLEVTDGGNNQWKFSEYFEIKSGVKELDKKSI